MQVALHSQEENVQSLPQIFTVFISGNRSVSDTDRSHSTATWLVPEDMEEVVKNALQDGGSVQVSHARHQDLTLVCIPRDDSGWDELATTGVVVSLVQPQELERSLHSGNYR